MDALLYTFSRTLAAIPSWPILVCIHYYFTAVALRNEPGGRTLAVDHPVASCLLCVVIAGSGTIISSLMLGQPLLNSALNERGIWTGVFIWYLVHHSPHDLFYNLSKYKYTKLFLNIMEEFRRARNVMIGVILASEVYPDSILPLALAGMFKGTGKRWSITLHHLFIGHSKPHELLNLSFCTKASFILGMAYTVLLNTKLMGTDELVALGSCLLCTVKAYEVIHNNTNTDPVKGLQENLWRFIIFKQSEKEDSKQNTVKKEQ